MPNRDIIVIGGSTGGTEALKHIVAALPSDLAAAVFVVLHRPASGKSLLADVLNQVGQLHAEQAVDGEPIVKGRIYIPEADRHLMVTRDGVLLGRGPRENMTRPSVDPLFRSAAIAFGPRVIGVVVSGRLDDGASGLDAIKRCGGLAVVQMPTDAIADDMPRAALETVTVDHCVPAAEIGQVLRTLVAEPAPAALPIPPDLELEVAIASGSTSQPGQFDDIATLSRFTCPHCSGVLSEVRDARPPRFRCQTGHALTAKALDAAHGESLEEALYIALRIMQERIALVTRLASDARLSGRTTVADLYQNRAEEYYGYADTIRRAALRMAGP